MTDPPDPVLSDLAESLGIAVRDLGRIRDKLEAAHARIASAPEPLEIYGAAALVSGYYSHLERIFERIVRDMNTGPLSGADWHRRLLASMTAERPGLRPAVLDVELGERLEELLAFRHLFRNLYVLELRVERVADLLRLATAIHQPLVASLSAFRQFVTDLAADHAKGS